MSLLLVLTKTILSEFSAKYLDLYSIRCSLLVGSGGSCMNGALAETQPIKM